MKLFLTFLMLLAQVGHAAPTLNPIFNDNMLLQGHPKSARLWGEKAADDPEFQVKICRSNYCENDENKSCTQDTDCESGLCALSCANCISEKTIPQDGLTTWESFVISPLPKSLNQETYNICINDTVLAKNVIIGDLWLMAGQSNMVYDYKYPSRLDVLLNNKIRGIDTLKSKSKRWMVIGDDDFTEGYGMSFYPFFFLKSLSESYDYPFGGIVTAYPGSGIASWMKTRSPRGKIIEGQNYTKRFLPISKMTFSGIYWWQGERNLQAASEIYPERLDDLVSQWRSDLGDENLPFIYTQLPTINKIKDDRSRQPARMPPMETKFARSRTRMLEPYLSKNVPNLHIISTVDVRSKKNAQQWPHPPENDGIVRAASLTAKIALYGEPVTPTGPLPKKIERINNECVNISYEDQTIGKKLKITPRRIGSVPLPLEGFYLSFGTCTPDFPREWTKAYSLINKDRKSVTACIKSNSYKVNVAKNLLDGKRVKLTVPTDYCQNNVFKSCTVDADCESSSCVSNPSKREFIFKFVNDIDTQENEDTQVLIGRSIGGTLQKLDSKIEKVTGIISDVETRTNVINFSGFDIKVEFDDGVASKLPSPTGPITHIAYAWGAWLEWATLQNSFSMGAMPFNTYKNEFLTEGENRIWQCP